MAPPRESTSLFSRISFPLSRVPDVIQPFPRGSFFCTDPSHLSAPSRPPPKFRGDSAPGCIVSCFAIPLSSPSLSVVFFRCFRASPPILIVRSCAPPLRTFLVFVWTVSLFDLVALHCSSRFLPPFSLRSPRAINRSFACFPPRPLSNDLLRAVAVDFAGGDLFLFGTALLDPRAVLRSIVPFRFCARSPSL